MELSYQSMKIYHQAREADERRTELRKRSLLVLIQHHLLECGYVAAAVALDQETGGSLRRFQACDNVDLEVVLCEYESYHYCKHSKYPKFIRKATEGSDEERHSRSAGARRVLSVKHLPKIPPRQTSPPPPDRGTKRTTGGPHTHESTGPGGAPELPTFGLTVAPIRSLACGEAAVPASRKSASSGDGRRLTHDVVAGGSSDSEHLERLLRPLSGFCGLGSEMSELAAIISTNIYVQNPNVCWDDIIGLDDAKRLVKEAVVYPIKYPQLFTGILSPWKALLLYGPPGTGKTLLAKAVATECNTTFFNISASTIVSKWRGESEKLVRVLFELARYHAPSTIFLDELESVIGQRGHSLGQEHESSRRLKTELLIQMDGLTHSDDLVFVLAASNLPWDLDHAMLRRLEKRILVDLPTPAARQAMISHWLPPISSSAPTGGVELRTELDYEVLAMRTDGYSGSDVRLVCREAAMRPVRKIFDLLESPQQGDFLDVPAVRLETVTTADVLEVLDHTRPSAGHLMDKYTAWQRDYQSV
ncbi:katanin p60 ATPase-containing subunit A-like 2 isoform X2 [Nelusetta ayraudi]|uniref:katanin p60 ATPase-containing subunit A-like 2 isoform X2 n=1 Tax=Nelusetta ayraudi TaxID=303726 RepID=UPI003F6F8037